MIKSLVLAACILVCAASARAQVASACVGPAPTGTGPMRIIDSVNLSLAFEYPDAEWTNIVESRLRISRANGSGGVLSTQVVTKAATTRVGEGNGSGMGCYTIPVVPVDQLPRGIPLQATLSVSGTANDPLLESLPSNPTDPFGRRGSAPIMRNPLP